MPAFPQTSASISALNRHIYNEQDGILQHNFIFYTRVKNGKFYGIPYMYNEILVIGNNYNKRIKFTDVDSHKDIIDLKACDNKVIMYQVQKINIIENDIISHTISLPKTLSIRNECCVSNNYFIAETKDTYVAFTIENNKTLKELSRFSKNGITDIRLLNHKKDYFVSLIYNNYIQTYVLPNQKIKIYPILELKYKNSYIQYNYIIYNLCHYGYNIKNWISKNRFYSFLNNPNPHNEFFPYDKELLSDKDIHKYAYTLLEYKNNLKESVLFENPVHCKASKPYCFPSTLYIVNDNKLTRIFPYLRAYSNIYNNSNSSKTYTLAQDNDNNIWAGSYNGGLSVITKNKIEELPFNHLQFMPGNIKIGDKLYFFTSSVPKTLIGFNKNKKSDVIEKNVINYIAYKSKRNKHIYIGTYDYNGIWQTDSVSLYKQHPKWHKIDTNNGIGLRSVVTITEDTLGRIWFGQKGIGVYDPKTNKAVTWTSKKKQTDLSLLSSLTDTWGTVWFGGINGLYYYDTYHKKNVSITDIKKLDHELISNGSIVSSLAQWEKWLIIGQRNKICLLDLETWHKSKNVVVRYLNPIELYFTSPIEQNVFLIDRRDSSIWFSTTDLVYQWNIKHWLNLPVYKITPTVELKNSDNYHPIHHTKKVTLSHSQNTLQFKIWFQTPDNMPRYMSTCLLKKGDSLIYTNPDTQTIFTYPNLVPGEYTFYIKIFQNTGETSIYKYNIKIKQVWSKIWWTWVLLSLIFIFPIFLWLNTLRKKEIIAREKAQQNSKLLHLQLAMLYNQFRPHFILNTLNVMGAKCDNNPEAESILSRLGESISIIFNHAHSFKILHPFPDEWKLILNVIAIHKQMYLNDLVVNLPDEAFLKKATNILLPMGLIQIPVENALLHGLGNKTSGIFMLNISIQEEENVVKVIIEDNGVGRNKSATLSNYSQHGTGSKNLSEIIKIINSLNLTYTFAITYDDDIYKTENNISYGTRVNIVIRQLSLYGIK